MPENEPENPEKKPENTPKDDEPKPVASDPKEPEKPDEEKFDQERAMATIRAQRESENKLKSELKDLREAKAELDKIKEQDLSEKEKQEKRISELESRVSNADGELQEARLLREVVGSKVDIADPELAVLLLKDRVTYEDGKPQDVDKALTALLDEKPILKGKPTAPNVDGGAGGETAKPSLTAEEAQFAQMFGIKPEDYAAWKDKSNVSDLVKRETAEKK